MSRYKPINENRKVTINDVYGNQVGNFFSKIEIRNFKANVEVCGDAVAGITATLDMIYNLCNKTGFSKEMLLKMINRVWEEKDGNKSDDN